MARQCGTAPHHDVCTSGSGLLPRLERTPCAACVQILILWIVAAGLLTTHPLQLESAVGAATIG